MYIYITEPVCCTFIILWNKHSIINQLYSNEIKKKFKAKSQGFWGLSYQLKKKKHSVSKYVEEWK